VLKKGDIFAGYAIQRVLGQGGMGTVYLAQHPRLPRLTALKLLNRDLYTDTEIRRRFEREADLVAQLDHPNIVTVYDRGTEDEQLWISMQFVPGADASCADVNVLAPWRAVQIIAETAAALDFAHANSVLHRDVKPANILLAKAPIGQPERVLLTDFGIAGMRDSDTTLSSAGSITATLAYAAPEQLLGMSLDDRADQYSLACTLFWMLTGVGPFPGTNPMGVINGHLYGPVPVLSRTRPGLPPALDAVLARAMAKRPADRFGSCAEFAAAARRALTPGGPQRPQHAPMHTGRVAPGGPTQAPLGPAHNVPLQSWPPHAAPSQQTRRQAAPQQNRPPHAAPAQHAAPQQNRPPHAAPAQHAAPQQNRPPHAAPAHTVAPQSATPRSSSTPPETRAPQNNSPTENSVPPGTRVPPEPHVAPQTSAPQRNSAQPRTPERFETGQPARSTEPPNGTGAPRMPLPPRRTPRPGTIALPDVRVRPPRSASSGPEQHPPP
jgi:serine/threonine-protein kinase